MPPGLTETLAALAVEPTHDVYQSVMDEIGGSCERLSRTRRQAFVQVDASEFDVASLRSWLTDLAGISADAIVRVAWTADRVGVEMRFGDFADRVDDLWYPAMDDVVAVLDRGRHLDVLLIDHEERITLTRTHAHGWHQRATPTTRGPSEPQQTTACIKRYLP